MVVEPMGQRKHRDGPRNPSNVALFGSLPMPHKTHVRYRRESLEQAHRSILARSRPRRGDPSKNPDWRPVDSVAKNSQGGFYGVPPSGLDAPPRPRVRRTAGRLEPPLEPNGDAGRTDAPERPPEG
jgi:hypothetical protein